MRGRTLFDTQDLTCCIFWSLTPPSCSYWAAGIPWMASIDFSFLFLLFFYSDISDFSRRFHGFLFFDEDAFGRSTSSG